LPPADGGARPNPTKENTMRRIPVDTTAVRFIATGKGAARSKYAQMSDGTSRRVPDQHETDDQGRTIFVIDCMVDDPDAERAEIASVKVPSHEEPVTTFGQVIEFEGLVALPYVQQGTSRVAISFSATGIRQPQAPGKAA
jgi:hypothetical protein